MDINELYIKAQNGGPADENALFLELTARLIVIATQKVTNRQDAEEIVQDTLMIISQKYRDFDYYASFAAWAQKILYYVTMNYYRKKKTLKSKLVDAVPENLFGASWQNESNIKIGLIECFKKISRSNNRYARVLSLHYQGFNSDEICKRMNTTKNNLYSLLSRARSLLLHCLETGDIKNEDMH